MGINFRMVDTKADYEIFVRLISYVCCAHSSPTHISVTHISVIASSMDMMVQSSGIIKSFLEHQNTDSSVKRKLPYMRRDLM